MTNLQSVFSALTGFEPGSNFSSAADCMTSEYIHDDAHSDADMLEQIVEYAANVLDISLDETNADKILNALKTVKNLQKNGNSEESYQCYDIAYSELAD